MSELDLFRDFRGGVAAPSDDARQLAAARLASAIEGQPWSGAKILRPIRRRPGRAVLAMAALVGATAAALFVSTPWQSAPRLGFLEQVQAALTPPQGKILHMKVHVVLTISGAVCTSTGGHEFWIDTTPPHAFRAIMRTAAPPANVESCPDKLMPPYEVGGVLGGPTLKFVPPNTLVPHAPIYWSGVDEDPFALVRKLISEGRAHREGTTQLDGRTVERVRFDTFDTPTSCGAPGHCPTESEYGYFDAETLYPVVWEYARDPAYPLRRQRDQYLEYEYLPRTDDNLALTDIRAQHPHAIERLVP